jgi:hypothetical protein
VFLVNTQKKMETDFYALCVLLLLFYPATYLLLLLTIFETLNVRVV